MAEGKTMSVAELVAGLEAQDGGLAAMIEHLNAQDDVFVFEAEDDIIAHVKDMGYTVKKGTDSKIVLFSGNTDAATYLGIVQVGNVYGLPKTKAVRLLLGLDKDPEVKNVMLYASTPARPKVLNFNVSMTEREEQTVIGDKVKLLSDATAKAIEAMPEDMRGYVEMPKLTNWSILRNSLDIFRKGPVWAKVVMDGRKAIAEARTELDEQIAKTKEAIKSARGNPRKKIEATLVDLEAESRALGVATGEVDESETD